MAIFLKNISFQGIMLDELINNVSDEMSLELFEIFKKGIADGVVKPLNTTVFHHQEAEKAFRYMASGKHMGKVVLKIRDEEMEKKAIPSPLYVTAKQRTIFNPEKSYIIIGGLGGTGLELCQWLIERGAKNVVLTSRSGVTTGYQKMCLKRWKQYYSVNVVVSKLNAVKEDEARDLLLLARKQGPVGGIFNLALVLKDALMENQTVQNYIDVCESKIDSTINLDLLTREMCPDLDMFVCFSSVACGRGNPGQSNYGFANSVMERICEDRVNDGLPGLAVQWGAIGDVGFIGEKMGSDVVIKGTVPQRISSCLLVFEKFFQQHCPVVSSMVLYQADEAKISIKEDLLAYIANIFGIKDVASINREATLKELGMDSLMGVELKHILEHNFDIVLSINELHNLKVKDLENISDKKGTKDVQKVTENQAMDIQMHFGKYTALNIKELISSDVIIHMNEITDGIPLFIVHPYEGSVTSLKSLAEILPCPVYGIKSTLEAPRDSIENLASWYWKNIKSMNMATKHVNLAGYSFGVTVAFEMALQLEQDVNSYPEIKNLIFLDGSHIYLGAIIRTLSNLSDENMENATDQTLALIAFSKMFSNDNLLDKKELLNLKDLSERISYTANKIASAPPDFCYNDIIAVFDLFLSKMQMACKYVPKRKLKKDVHLIKSSENFLRVGKILSDVYDLDKVCEGKISSYVIQGSHSSFIQENSVKEVSRLMANIFESK